MGNFCGSCFKGNADTSDLLATPDAETKRQQMAAAAERRIQEMESKGIKNIDSVKRAQMKAIEREKLEDKAGNSEPGLRWQQD